MALPILEARRLLGGNSSSGGIFGGSSNHTCPVESLAENASQPFTGSMSFYTFNEILSGACAAFAVIAIGVFMLIHANHMSKPNEQLKILRISFLIPAYAVAAFITVVSPAAWVYLWPWLDVVQAIALSSFFLLLCQFVSPSDQHRDVFLAALHIEDKKKQTVTDGLTWFRRKWFLIFQYPVVAVLVAVITDITQAAGVYCQFESKPWFAHLWLNIVIKVSLVLAVLSVFKFYRQLRAELDPFKPLQKFMAFKLVVALTFIENIVFWILRDVNNGSALNPTPQLTYADLNIGIPGLIICLLMVPLSAFFHHAYSYKAYKIGGKQGPRPVTGGVDGYEPRSYTGGFLGLGALIEMFNPKEVIEAIIFGFRMQAAGRGRRDPESAAPMYNNGGYNNGGYNNGGGYPPQQYQGGYGGTQGRY